MVVSEAMAGLFNIKFSSNNLQNLLSIIIQGMRALEGTVKALQGLKANRSELLEGKKYPSLEETNKN